MKVQDLRLSYVEGMAVVFDPGSPPSSEAVIRKQIVVGCILLY